MKNLLGVGAVALALSLSGFTTRADATTFGISACISGTNCAALDPGATVDVQIVDAMNGDLAFSVANSTNGALDYLRFFYTGTLPTNAQLINFTASPATIGSPTVTFVGGTDAGYEF